MTTITNNPDKPIRVLVVDDSKTIREILTEIINNNSDIRVIGAAADAYEARDLIKKLKPDVVTLDVEMPRMNGLEFLARLMKAHPLPVVMISTLTERGSETTLRALELGAVEFIAKPKLTPDALDGYGQEIADKIRAASRARLRLPPRVQSPCFPASPAVAALLEKKRLLSTLAPAKHSTQIIAVGASTGGTEALREFLLDMPINCPGILIVQHMPEVFTKMFAERLNGLCNITIKEAENNDPVLFGHAYIAPGGKHLSVKKDGHRFIIKITEDPPVNLHRPSVDFLFQSVAKNVGNNAIGVIMTGMGRDGAQGILQMKRAGSWNFAQDEKSSVIFGMPKEAIEIGAIHDIVPLSKLCERVLGKLSLTKR